jgi:hypothetical protein
MDTKRLPGRYARDGGAIEMNNKERDIIFRIHKAIGGIPAAQDGGGSQTATMAGYVSASEDWRVVAPFLQHALMGMIWQDNIRKNPELRSEIVEGIDYHCPKRVMDAVEEWIAVRIAQGWKLGSRYALENIYATRRATSR